MAVACGCAREAPPGAPDALPKAVLTVAGYEVNVELALTEEEQQRGLMGRERLGENEGMLFVYRRDQELAFWMKNTLVPLSIAFIRADGTIANIEDMAPLTLETHYSEGPVRCALEMERGWFARRGIGPGNRVIMPEGVATP